MNKDGLLLSVSDYDCQKRVYKWTWLVIILSPIPIKGCKRTPEELIHCAELNHLVVSMYRFHLF